MSYPFPYQVTLSQARRLAMFVLIVLIVLFSGCGGGSSGAVLLNQTGSSGASVRTDTIPLNNCAGKEKITTTLAHSLDIGIEGGLGVEIKVVEASLRAKYERGQTSSIELPAAPGTNMEYIVEWTDESFFGEVEVDGQTGQAAYTVQVSTPSVTGSVDRGCISGAYQLVRWEEATSPITLYMEVDSGTLIIEPSGDATWTLVIRERGEYPSPQPTITCQGRFYTNTQKLEGAPDGHAADWTFDMSGFALDLWLAFCGRNVGGDSDAFTLYPRELGGGKRELEMKNSKGTLIWEQ